MWLANLTLDFDGMGDPIETVYALKVIATQGGAQATLRILWIFFCKKIGKP